MPDDLHQLREDLATLHATLRQNPPTEDTARTLQAILSQIDAALAENPKGDARPGTASPETTIRRLTAQKKEQQAQLRRLERKIAALEEATDDHQASKGSTQTDPRVVLRERNTSIVKKMRALADSQESGSTALADKLESLLEHFSTETARKRKRHLPRLADELTSSLHKLAARARNQGAKAGRTTTRRAEGVLDEVSTRQVKGWAWNPKLPEEHLQVQLLVDGEVAATGFADLPRADVLREGLGDGCYGFRFKIPRQHMDGSEKEVAVEVPGYENRIVNSPTRVTLRKAIEAADAKAVGASQYTPSSGGTFAGIHVPGTLARKVARAASTWGKVSVIIPVYNAPGELKACLRSVLANTTTEHEIVLVDDCSPDPEIAEILDHAARDARVRLLKTDTNLGFVGAVNLGLAETSGDVVLLNSDTIVPPRWLLRLRVAAESDPEAATVTPMTNAGGAFSIPDYGTDAPLPPDLDVPAAAHLVARASRFHYGEIPTGNGFCLYVRRAALQEVGPLDEKTFGRGYGEENDLCMRMREKGWSHILDDASFIYHRGHASFGKEGSAAQLDENLKVLYDRYPEYRELVAREFHTAGMRQARERIASAWDSAPACDDARRPRILAVLHEGEGGVLVTAEDIFQRLPDFWVKFLLTSDGERIFLREVFDGEHIDVAQWDMRGMWSARLFNLQEWQDVYTAALLGLDIDVVHVHHLFKHTFDLPSLCRQLGIPYLLSLHDYYFLNPSLQLLDDTGKFCPDMQPSQGAAGWEIASPMLADVDFDTPEAQALWTGRCEEILTGAHSIIAPSECCRQIHLQNAACLDGRKEKVHAIGHGRDFEFRTASPTANTLATGNSVRVLCLGALDRHKGGPLLKELKAIDHENLLDLHFVGRENPKLSSCGEQHGAYSRNEVVGIISELEPAYAVILSTWGETFSYTLTECWAAGIPVLTLDLGAPAERIRKLGGGWIQKDPDPAALHARMVELGRDTKELDAKRAEIARMQPTSCSEMALQYDELYHRATNPHATAREKWAVFTPDGDAGSTFIRTFLPLEHPSARTRIQPHYLKNDIPPDYLAAFLQRNAIDRILVQRAPFENKEAAAPIIAAARETGTPITIDLDDDLFQVADSHPDAAQYRDSVDALRDVAAAASQITVSTPTLAKALSWIDHADIEVIPNRLDERLWFAPLDTLGERPPKRAGKPAKIDEITIGYFGTYTHGSDLEIAKEGILHARKQLAQEGTTLRLEVIGALLPAEKEKEDPWFDRIDLPENNAYPHFVPWLREQALRWDLGIAPLQDTPLNRSKSAIKLLEYAALGIPSIASEVGEYAGLAPSCGTVLVPPDATPEDWCAAILALARDLPPTIPFPPTRTLATAEPTPPAPA